MSLNDNPRRAFTPGATFRAPSRSEPEIGLIGPDGNGDRILAHCVASRSRFRVSTFRGWPLSSFSSNLYARRERLTPKPSRVFAIS